MNTKKGRTEQPLSFFTPLDKAMPLITLASKKSSKILFASLMHFLERRWGLRFGLRVPAVLRADPLLWEGHLLLEKMKGLGLIKQWRGYHSSEVFPDEPPLHMYLIKNTFDEKSSIVGGDGIGRHFSIPEKALWAGIGESIERRCIDFFSPAPSAFTDATSEELGSTALDLSMLAGISPETRKKDVTLAFSNKNKFRWVKGYSLTNKEKLWVPLQLVSFRHHEAFYEPRLRSLVSTGAATHRTLPEALLGGILEVLERDAFVVTWLNKLSPEYIVLDDIVDDELGSIIEKARQYHLEVHVVRMPTDFEGVHAILAILLDKTGVGPAVNLGAKAGFDLEDTIKGVLTEALGTRLFVRQRYNYAQKEGKDLRFENKNVIGLKERTLYWCDPQKIERVTFLLQGKKISPKTYPSPSSGLRDVNQKVNFLIDLFRKKNLQLTYVDIMPSFLKKELGLQTIMVVAPELQPLSLHEIPPHNWGSRLKSVPLYCGYQPREKPFTEIHPFP